MKIELIPENPQKDLLIVRIEIVRIFKNDEEYYDDDSASFNFSYNQDDPESYDMMINQISEKYNIPEDFISVNFD
ncbi:MAG: hypothetical protein SOT81_07100 [Treponema sp.]|nr:hypothetical protein [Treponema sp.]